ncbi:MAG TPA: stage II sporulation protein M [Gammaproteobacteria bacterium]|nr:stage II sporulation protein M [Gammaproteobacteria bacterium]
MSSRSEIAGAGRERASPQSSTARRDQARTASWFSQRLPAWKDIAGRLSGLEHGASAKTEDVFAAVRSYPGIARDLAIARRAAPQAQLTRYLERIYLELHRALFRRPSDWKRELEALFLLEAPAVAKSLRAQIVCVAVLFAACTGAGAALVSAYPELVSLFASEQMIEQVMHGELWTDGLLNVLPSSILSVQIFTNNIVVALFTLCLGVAYGLGTVYIVGMNGLMLGGVFAFTARYGLAGRLFEFICAHGFVELSSICVAGAIGASLGEALARPGRVSRRTAFQHATARGAKLMLVLAVFLVGSGLLEGFVSPDPAYPWPAKLAIGLAYFVLFLFVLSGAAGRRFLRR